MLGIISIIVVAYAKADISPESKNEAKNLSVKIKR